MFFSRAIIFKKQCKKKIKVGPFSPRERKRCVETEKRGGGGGLLKQVGLEQKCLYIEVKRGL